MKKCYNCNGLNHNTDKYCRYCGHMIKSNLYYILINITTIISIVAFLLIIALFIVSYFI